MYEAQNRFSLLSSLPSTTHPNFTTGKRLVHYSSNSTAGSLNELAMEYPDDLEDDWTPSNGDFVPEPSKNIKRTDKNVLQQQQELQILDELFSSEPSSVYLDATTTIAPPVQQHQLVPPAETYQTHTWQPRTTPVYPPPYRYVHRTQYENVFQQRNAMVQQMQKSFLPTPTTEVDQSLPPVESTTRLTNHQLKRKHSSSTTIGETGGRTFTRSGRIVKRNKYVNQEELLQQHQIDDDGSIENDTFVPDEKVEPYSENAFADDITPTSNQTTSEASDKIKTLKLYGSPTPKKSGLTSRFRGVCWYKRTNKWVVQIKVKGKRKHIGYFSNEEEAAAAYDNALRDLIKIQQKELEDQAKTTSKVRIPRRRIFNNTPPDI